MKNECGERKEDNSPMKIGFQSSFSLLMLCFKIGRGG